ncbi:interleukin 17a/f3 [Colossoma macropomum]|uniref:interleukin 17a/f3 n=1 Tax=Colossoma macropomum TaxID=42526 RepID=UPI0018641B23|nr:interleukin 17a/f3 [Colossoma macropomum]
MRVSVFFRAMLVVVLVALLLGEDSSPSHKNRGKKEKKSRGAAALSKPNRGSRGKMRKLWISLDQDLINPSDSSLLSPNLSTSPWTYEASYDESRIPSRIFEAKCERKGCVTKDGHEDTALQSKPVYYQILVLRRVKSKKKKYALRLEKMTISVGCTCTLPTVISQMS